MRGCCSPWRSCCCTRMTRTSQVREDKGCATQVKARYSTAKQAICSYLQKCKVALELLAIAKHLHATMQAGFGYCKHRCGL